MKVTDSTGWEIVPGCMVKMWERTGTKPWRAWVVAVEVDDVHGPALILECAKRASAHQVALARLKKVVVQRPTLFQKSRRVGIQAEAAHARERLKRRRTGSPRRGSKRDSSPGSGRR